MSDPLADVGEDLEDEVAAEGAVDTPLGEFVSSLRSATDDSLRLVVRFSGEDHEVRYVRDDVRESHSEESFAERVRTLVLKGLGDPAHDDTLEDFGDLDATVRWFDEVVVATYPYGEWSGVIAVLDRRDAPLVDVAVDHLD